MRARGRPRARGAPAASSCRRPRPTSLACLGLAHLQSRFFRFVVADRDQCRHVQRLSGGGSPTHDEASTASSGEHRAKRARRRSPPQRRRPPIRKKQPIQLPIRSVDRLGIAQIAPVRSAPMRGRQDVGQAVLVHIPNRRPKGRERATAVPRWQNPPDRAPYSPLPGLSVGNHVVVIARKDSPGFT